MAKRVIVVHESIRSVAAQHWLAAD